MNEKRLASVLLILALGLALLSSARPAWAATYTVDITADETDGSCTDDDCSLRDAILLANSNPGPDTIAFNIDAAADPGCDAAGVCVIQPASYLPSLLDDGTTIDGYTQPGAAPATLQEPAIILIEIDGTNVTANNGLNILSADNVVSGLAINRFGLSGIAIGYADATGNIIQGSYLGLDATGTLVRGNGLHGVYIAYGATNNTVGGNAVQRRNVISGNGWAGVSIYDAGTSGNAIHNNYIGTDETGMLDLGNALDGVWIYGDAHDNVVAGGWLEPINGDGHNSVQMVGNWCNQIISGNGRNGVRVVGGSGNLVQDNFIGLRADGWYNCGNDQSGVYLESTSNNAIWANSISGNQYGVEISGAGATGNVVTENKVGTDWLGSQACPNLLGGVHVGNGASGNAIGPGNLISGNDGIGVMIESATGNEVSGNYIGTDVDGLQPLQNLGINIYLGSDAHDNVVGGLDVDDRNVIAASPRDGIYATAGAWNNTIAGNYIGTNATGTAAMANVENGIFLDLGAHDNLIGPDNVISGNGLCGIRLLGGNTAGNQIAGNIIGADASGEAALGNSLAGIELAEGTHGNVIGSTLPGTGNLISQLVRHQVGGHHRQHHLR